MVSSASLFVRRNMLPLVASVLTLYVSAVDARARLSNFSFSGPLTYENGIGNWSFGGTAVALKSGVVLVPGVPERRGLFWNNNPFVLTDFEIEVSFRFETGRAEVPASPGIALWLVYDQVPKDLLVSQPPKEATSEANLFGFKNAYNGLGAFVAQFDRDGKPKGSVSLEVNDGSKIVDEMTGVPSGYGIYYSAVESDQRRNPMTLRLTVTSSTINGMIRQANEPSWNQAFNISSTEFLKGVKLGQPLTVGLSSSTTKSSPADRIIVESVDMYDLRAQDTEVADVLSTDIANGDGSVAQYRILKDLHASIAVQTLKIDNLTAMVERLHRDTATAIVKQDGSNMREELSGLRNMLDNISQKHERGYDDVRSQIDRYARTVSAKDPMAMVAKQASALEDAIKNQAWFSSWMIFGVIVMIALFALFMWKRMRDMEKKHFL